MKITDKYLSIPPYLCVSWDQVCLIEGHNLPDEALAITLHLNSGKQVRLPAVGSSDAQRIFSAFQNAQDRRDQIKIRLRSPASPAPQTMGVGLALPLNFLQTLLQSLPASLEHLASSLKHNAQTSDLPVLPIELLEKIAQNARQNPQKNEEEPLLGAPHLGCHCLHCQVARAVQGGLEHGAEPISAQDLQFAQWQIRSAGSDEYLVSSADDSDQVYRVQLKPTICCSCQEPGCAHIAAVLRS